LSKLILPRWETPTPKGVKGSYGPAVREWGKRERGREYGPWQRYAIDQALRYDANGDTIARLILLGVGRQNGKTVIVEDVIGWMLDEGRKLPAFEGWTEMLAAAHDAPQARKMYNRVRAGIEANEQLSKRVRTTQWAGIRSGPLELNTVTGQPGSARGSAAGLIAWDEVLTQKDFDMWAALGPTQSAQRSPIMLLTSTAGTVESALLRSFYDRLVRMAEGAEKPDPHFYGAWWATKDPDIAAETAQSGKPITKAEWRDILNANPSIGDGRLTKEAVEVDHGILPPDHWRRERNNHFVIERARDPLFTVGLWARARDFPESRPLDDLHGPYALGIREHVGWERATICVAGIREDGRVGVEVYRDLRDSPTAQTIIDAVRDFPDQASLQVIAFDSQSGGAPEFRRQRDEQRGPWDELLPSAVVSACMDVTEMVQAGRLAVRDPLIDAQVAGGSRRPVGQDGAFRFSVRDSLGPIDAVLGMAFAAHAIAYKPPPVQIFL